MRMSLIVFGVIFLAIGGLLYLYPSPTIGAQTSTVGTDGTDLRDSSATLSIPIEWSIALLTIGGILFFLGLVIPGPVKNIQGPRGPRGKSYPRRRSIPRRARRASLPSGTSVTTTTTRTGR